MDQTPFMTIESAEGRRASSDRQVTKEEIANARSIILEARAKLSKEQTPASTPKRK